MNAREIHTTKMAARFLYDRAISSSKKDAFLNIPECDSFYLHVDEIIATIKETIPGSSVVRKDVPYGEPGADLFISW